VTSYNIILRPRLTARIGLACLMDAKRISNTSGVILLALTTTTSAGPMSFARSKVIAPQQAQTEPAYYGCHGYYGWVPGRDDRRPDGRLPLFRLVRLSLSAIPILRPSVSSSLLSLPSPTLSPLWLVVGPFTGCLKRQNGKDLRETGDHLKHAG
jgi:hypothetical protein